MIQIDRQVAGKAATSKAWPVILRSGSDEEPLFLLTLLRRDSSTARPGRKSKRYDFRHKQASGRSAQNDNSLLRISRGGFGAGANLLPALGALLGVENFFAQAERFGCDFDVFVVGDVLDGLFEA